MPFLLLLLILNTARHFSQFIILEQALTECSLLNPLAPMSVLQHLLFFCLKTTSVILLCAGDSERQEAGSLAALKVTTVFF